MGQLHAEVLVGTPFNGVLALDIKSSYLEDTYEELSQQELVEYLRELARTLSS